MNGPQVATTPERRQVSGSLGLVLAGRSGEMVFDPLRRPGLSPEHRHDSASPVPSISAFNRVVAPARACGDGPTDLPAVPNAAKPATDVRSRAPHDLDCTSVNRVIVP